MKKNKPNAIETLFDALSAGASIESFPKMMLAVARVVEGLTTAVKTLKFTDEDEFRHPLLSLMLLHKDPQMLAHIADLLIWGDDPKVFTLDITDQGLPFAELLAAGTYVHVDEPITKLKLPGVAITGVPKRIHMIGGRSWDSIDVIIAALSVRKFRLATVREILCVGSQHPHIQEAERIMTLDMKGQAGKKGAVVALDNCYHDPTAPDDERFPYGRSVNYESYTPSEGDWIAAVNIA